MHQAITGNFRFVVAKKSGRGITGISCCHRFQIPSGFEERFQKAPVSRQTTAQPRSQGLSSSHSRG